MGSKAETGPARRTRARAKDVSVPSLTDIQIEIGGSSYLLSQEAQKHLRRDISSTLFYESSSSVLVIQEPHESAEGQLNLYKGLEIFFRDNPELVEKTIFLAEGYPAHQLVSVRSLIEADPHPSDSLIKKTLGTFLITGYMAYEWKHQQGIPIVGTEDEWFYQMSRDFAVAHARNPKARFGSVRFKDGKTVDVTFEEALYFSFVVRNKSIAATLFDKAKYYENPILFVGAQHLKGMDEAEFDFIKDFTAGGIFGSFGPYARSVETSAENFGIYHYLEREKMGFTLLNPSGLDKTRKDDSNSYVHLFKAQQEGEWRHGGREEHRKYLEWLLAKKRAKQGITIRPSPETAAQFVRALRGEKESAPQSGVVYDASQEQPEIVSRDYVRAKLGRDSLWSEKGKKIGIFPRGEDFETLRGANLGSNCPGIDHHDSDQRLVISMKSIDLTDNYYQDPEKMDYITGGYIEMLSEFSGVHWRGHYITEDDFDVKYLELAIPVGVATPAQRQKIKELQEYARSVGVILKIVEVS